MKQNTIDKAKATTYKHASWFLNSDKSVYDAVKYFVESGDFALELKPSVISPMPVDGLTHKVYSVSEVVEYCVEHIDSHWKYLRIKGEGGADAGKLKILTFVKMKYNRK